MKPLNKISAITIAVILFMALHYTLTYTANYIANNSDLYLKLLFWLNLLAYFLYVLSGFVANQLIKTKSIYIGFVTGIASALSSILIFGVGADLFGIFAILISGCILGGIGGALSLYINSRVANAL